MTSPTARFLLPNGTTAVAYPCTIVGRASTAGIQLLDPRVSEAHAMVSLRGQQLVLLALRQTILVDGRPLHEVPLHAGLQVELVPGVPLKVVDVCVPKATWLLSWSGEGGRGMQRLDYALLAQSASLLTAPMRVEPRFEASALARLWTDGDAIWIQLQDSAPFVLTPGASWTVRKTTFSVMHTKGGVNTTQRVDRGVRLELHDTWSRVDAPGRQTVMLSGAAATLLWELADFEAGPVPWTAVAAEVWPRVKDSRKRRKRLDDALHRMRRKLRDAGMRDDLVVATNGGEVMLNLAPGDTIDRRG